MIMMRIVDVWKQDNKILAYCTGAAIDGEFSCEEISVEGKNFLVSGVDVLTSVAGGRSVVLGLRAQNVSSIPLGSVTIVR